MSYSLEFHPEALAELECVTGDYEAKQPELGVRFREVVEKTCRTIVENPHLWRERAMGYRRVNLPGFSYFISFMLDGDRILVIAVPHSSRKPNYWANRIP